jgi:Sulfotransferase domain
MKEPVDRRIEGPRAHPAPSRLWSAIYKVSGAAIDPWAQRLRALHQRICWERFKRVVFVPEADDVYIVTYPKSGTTWMQRALQQLLSDGRTEFRHITDVSPWIEKMAVYRPDFVHTLRRPRCFKSHLRFEELPRPGRYIYVMRNVKDVLISYYEHAVYIDHFRGSFDQFFGDFMRGRVDFGTWFSHIESWWPHRNDPNVLFLTYEELHDDLASALRRVCDLCEIRFPEERLAEIRRNCDVTSMKALEHKFDPRLQSFVAGSFIREGKTGGWQRALDASIARTLDLEVEQLVARLGVGADETRLFRA